METFLANIYLQTKHGKLKPICALGMDFVAFRGKCCSIAAIARSLACKPLFVIAQRIAWSHNWHPVVSFHTMYIYVTRRRFYRLKLRSQKSSQFSRKTSFKPPKSIRSLFENAKRFEKLFWFCS